MKKRHSPKSMLSAVLAAALVFGGANALAVDKVKIGVFPVSSALPVFVAIDQGFFKEQNIDAEIVRLIGGPPNIAALIGGQIDASAVLVTIEGMNANLKKPGVAMYLSVNGQNHIHQMEQFVVRKGLDVKSLKDLKGRKIMTAPGPANYLMAKAVLTIAGLKEGEYQLDQLDMGQHVNAMTAGTFDAGYTLEPNATVMRKNGVAYTLESGVIAKYVLGDPNANAWAAGGVISSDFMKNRPEVARRFAAAWTKAIDFINSNPKEARKSLVKNTFTPPDVVDTVPLVKFTNVADLTNRDRQDFQAFIDYSTRNGVLPEQIDVNKYLLKF